MNSDLLIEAINIAARKLQENDVRRQALRTIITKHYYDTGSHGRNSFSIEEVEKEYESLQEQEFHFLDLHGISTEEASIRMREIVRSIKSQAPTYRERGFTMYIKPRLMSPFVEGDPPTVDDVIHKVIIEHTKKPDSQGPYR